MADRRSFLVCKAHGRDKLCTPEVEIGERFTTSGLPLWRCNSCQASKRSDAARAVLTNRQMASFMPIGTDYELVASIVLLETEVASK